MPTGYTGKVQDGCSFAEFLWGCARAFGANISMKDEPHDAKITIYRNDRFYAECLDEAKQSLAELKSISPQEMEARAEQHYAREREWYDKELRRRNDLRSRYMSMLAKVADWKPPTPGHVGLKDFMADQLRRSLEIDCAELRPPIKVSAREWLDEELRSAVRLVEYYEEKTKDEAIRIERQNAWNAALHDSVPQP